MFDADKLNEHIKQNFRAQELQRRESRRLRLLNEMALDNEELSADEKRVHKEAMEAIVKQQLAYEKECSPSYWHRLWNAILGR